MTAPTILVLDLGTSRLKATLLTPDGVEQLHASAGYPTYTPAPNHVEQLPDEWWAAACSAARDLWAQGADPAGVAMISVTGQMHGVVAVDANNTPLYPCLTLRDRRAGAQAAHLRESVGVDHIYTLTGARLDASAPPAKFLWFREQSALWPRIHTYLAPKDWLRQHLTGGQPVTDVIEAAGMGVYDVIRAEWSAAMAAACHTSIECLPVLQSAAALAGTLRPEPAAGLGLLEGVPVAVGAADDVQFLGAGLLDPGDCMEHLGSTGSLLMVVDHPVEDPTGTLELYPHLIPGCWIVGGSTSNAGGALEWLRAAFRHDSVLRLDDSARTPPIFVPYLAGERAPIWQPDARAAFWGLSLEHEQTDLIRAGFEGVAFSLRHLLDALEAVCGRVQQAIRVDASADARWLQLRADVYGRPLQTLEAVNTTALGAALVGACALGVYPDLASAVRATVTLDSTIAPEPSPALTRRYHAYRKLSAAVLDLAVGE